MTYRNPNKITETAGEDYVQSIVQSHNSIFNKINLQNDQGNDCYIEFVLNNYATNYGVFTQIKSGKSYKDLNGYKFSVDNAHLAYWSNCLYPVAGIVYDPDIGKAFWISITDYLKTNPDVIMSDSHTIRISAQQEFSKETFSTFAEYFIKHIDTFKSFENFGRSLNLFSQIGEGNNCYEGLKALYSNHRDKVSTWFYIITNFGKIKEEGIRRNIVGLLSNYIDNPYIFWHKDNIKYLPQPEMQSKLQNC